MQVGFIGLGRMGVGMAANLLKAGHQLRSITALPTRHMRSSSRAQGWLRERPTHVGAMWSSRARRRGAGLVCDRTASHSGCRGEAERL